MRHIIPILLLALMGCDTPSVDNPTGDCTAEGDGSHECYSASSGDAAYLPDCEAPRNRELWRVFAESDALAYMVPRPDAMGLANGACDDPEHAELFERNGLCDDVADPAVINNMTATDAMAISRVLHERLVFVATDSGWTPYAPFGDQVEACRGPLAEDADVEALCDDLIAHSDDGTCPTMAREHDAATSAAMAAGLNAVYGVD